MVSGARKTKGLGLVDVIIAVVLASLLAAVSVPAYSRFASRAKIAAAVADIGSLLSLIHI